LVDALRTRTTEARQSCQEAVASLANGRGDDPTHNKQCAGHASLSTTEMYIREAENLAAGFGDVFPKLQRP
jgi:hypothetical protein